MADVTARLLLVVGIVGVAVLVAAWMERRRGERRAPVAVGADVPPQIDRADFRRPDAPFLLLLFSSDACASCADMATRIAPLESAGVAVEVCEFAARRDLHEKYAIEAVPATGLYDRAGVADLTWIGPVGAEALWASVHDRTQTSD